MSAILNILISLGLDKTVFYQFAIFIITFTFLNYFVFVPYLRAYQERRKRTVGSQDVAKELQDEIAQIEARYSQNAKELNQLIKAEFDSKKVLAQKEVQAQIIEAQKQAQTKLTKEREAIKQTFNTAREQLKTFVPELGHEMTQRLLDR